jgi:membrane fusion protein (multidrug efflux system)
MTQSPPPISAHATGATVRRRPRLGLAFLIAAGLLVAAGTLLRATAPDPAALPTATAQLPTLSVIELAPSELVRRIAVTGLLEARRRVSLFAEEDGRVLEIGAEDLERVEAGQVLVRLDPLQAEIAIERARAATARADSEGVLARANLERNKGLAGRDVSSRAALDEAENAARLAVAAQIDAAASLAEAQDRLSKKTITAPFAGFLRAFEVEQGEYVRPGELLGELLDVDRLRIQVGLTDQQIIELEAGTPVEVELDALPGERLVGEVIRVAAAIDSRTHKFPIEIELDNPTGRLLPGMVARIHLTLGKARTAMTLPRDAVVDEYGLQFVFVVEQIEPGSYVVAKRRVDARRIAFRLTELEIASGVEPGERVAIEMVRQLNDGMPVRPIVAKIPAPLVTSGAGTGRSE